MASLYDSKKHHRRSIRLKNYDYTQAGAYFITISCQDQIHRFGRIEHGEMILNECGQVAYDAWIQLGERFQYFELDVFQIMPNHMHAILVLNDPTASNDENVPTVGATLAVALDNENTPTVEATLAVALDNENMHIQRAGASPARTIGAIVGAYKSLVANQCLEIYKSRNEIMGKLWLRNYWEHIIRKEEAYQNIANYILNNPVNWDKDRFR